MFDSTKSIAEADYGKLIAAEKKAELLGFFQAMARQLARRSISREMDSNTLSIHAWNAHRIDISKVLGNASGSLFKGEAWEFTGNWVRSERVRSHGRDVKVWRLREGY